MSRRNLESLKRTQGMLKTARGDAIECALVIKFIHLILFLGASCGPASRTPRDPPGRGSNGTALRPWRCGARCRPRSPRRRRPESRRPRSSASAAPASRRTPRSKKRGGVHPGRRGRREVERPVGMALQPLARLGRPVRRDVVENDVHRGSGVDPPSAPLSATWSRKERNSAGAVPLDRPAHDLAGGDVEGRQKAGGAVPPVVARSRLRMARRHGQRSPRASRRLSPRLLVHREHDGVVWRVDMQAHDIADLDLEPRVARDLEASMF